MNSVIARAERGFSELNTKGRVRNSMALSRGSQGKVNSEMQCDLLSGTYGTSPGFNTVNVVPKSGVIQGLLFVFSLT